MRELKFSMGSCINADAIEYMKTLEDGFFDSVIVDVPWSSAEEGEVMGRNTKGMRKLNFGSDIKSDDFYIIPFVEELVRVCKGNFVIFCGHQQLGKLRAFFNSRKDLQLFRVLNWEKSQVSPMNMDKFFLNSNELAVAFRKSKAYWGGGRETALLQGKTTPRGDVHPTVKPQWLLEKLISLTCPPDGIVGDLCAGSMSLAEAATSLGRRYVCVERDAEFFDKGIEFRKDRL